MPRKVEVTRSSGLSSPFSPFSTASQALSASCLPPGLINAKVLTSVLPQRQASLRNHNKALGCAKKLTKPAGLLEGVDVRGVCQLFPVGEDPVPPAGLKPDVWLQETCQGSKGAV